jgi:hypothetical protein
VSGTYVTAAGGSRGLPFTGCDAARRSRSAVLDRDDDDPEEEREDDDPRSRELPPPPPPPPLLLLRLPPPSRSRSEERLRLPPPRSDDDLDDDEDEDEDERRVSLLSLPSLLSEEERCLGAAAQVEFKRARFGNQDLMFKGKGF